MIPKILLTSFDIWQPHHQSNSSDDLLHELRQNHPLPYHIEWLRKLPVNSDQASQKVIAKIQEFHPDLLICCGMAESYLHLTIESRARREKETLYTPVNLTSLIADLTDTEISDDAGQFVCESLYYQVLKYLQTHSLNLPCIFIHVPCFTPENHNQIITDFRLILAKMVKTLPQKD